MAQRIEKLEGWFILLSGWSRCLAAFVAGAISALAMAPFDLVFVLFATFPVLVWLIDGASSEPGSNLFIRLYEGFKPGFFFGFGYFIAGLWWIGNALLVEADDFAWALPIAVLAVPAVLAIFWGTATAVARIFWFGEFRRIFMLAACLALFEYCRSFVATGFPWNAIGYAAYFDPLTMQSASVLGIYSMAAFVVLVATLPVVMLGTQGAAPLKKYVLILLWLALVTGHTGYGVWRLDNKEAGFAENVTLRLVQPAINQADKFNPEREAEFFKRYLDLSVAEQDGKKLSDVTHLIWPESVFPFLLTERRDALSAIAAMLPKGTSLITGAARAEQSGSSNGRSLVFNSVYVIDDRGIIVSAADKVHLVPFGEYLPFQ
ncbi:MAG: apolipoprotein N-acyltransferase, partial [Pseudomonadota bacterium]